MKTFETDCHIVINRSDVNLKGLKYEIIWHKETDQEVLVIRETKKTMLDFLGEYVADWAYDGADFIMLVKDEFDEYSEYNPFQIGETP
jgi:hypothetical protein